MSLDQNLFTLHVKPSETDPSVVDLIDPAGNVFYRKQRISGPVYATQLYDYVSQSLLVTATAPSSTSKVKILELRNPSVPVELKSSGTFTVKWTFRWEVHEFEWKREEFDIDDRKGLELVLLTALLTFLDSTESTSPKEEEQPSGRKQSTWTTLSPFAVAKPSTVTPNLPTPSQSGPATPLPPNIRTRAKSSPGPTQASQVTPDVPPPMIHSTSNPNLVTLTPPTSALTPPPVLHAPAKKFSSPPASPASGVDVIAQMQALRSVLHEVTIYSQGTVDDYARFCWRLLKDEAISFITIRSGSTVQVQKVLEVVEATKRLRFQKGPFIELLQFVTYYPLPVGTSREKLEERIRLASMTPKQLKKNQKQKEKAEKKRKGKGTKGKGKDPTDSLQAEELQIPPKSIHVRLTKVEMHQKQNPSKAEKIEDKGKSKSQPVEAPLPLDPRFTVQLPPSEIPSKFYTLPEKSRKTTQEYAAFNASPRTIPLESRRAVSEIWPADRHVSPANSRHSSRVPNQHVTPSAPTDLRRPSSSQPSLSHSASPPIHTLPTSSPSNSRPRPSQVTLSQDNITIQSASGSLKTPALPPRHSQSAVDSGKSVAGPSSDQAPPSYTEMITGNEVSLDVKHADGH
ncbi:hypothetical protein D9757_004393 [Collybiopsis confluens]|uniref:Uncharacterized protein n=1 Tax=Collybiopsis confluens TaxID=2823264 RepID=A0A8H5HTT5_9AGAR|nr:hypothetical protein D9757_004393 [Collybiopsis confluens]